MARKVTYWVSTVLVAALSIFAGAITLLVPGLAKLKEWAYAGFTFAWIAAIVALPHSLALGNGHICSPRTLISQPAFKTWSPLRASPTVYRSAWRRDVRWMARWMDFHPLKTMLEPLHLTRQRCTVPKTFIYCNNPAMGFFESFADKARVEKWNFHELATGHTAMVTAPAELTRVFLRIAD